MVVVSATSSVELSVEFLRIDACFNKNNEGLERAKVINFYLKIHPFLYR